MIEKLEKKEGEVIHLGEGISKKKVKCYNFPSDKELMEKINEIIDHLNAQEEDYGYSGTPEEVLQQMRDEMNKDIGLDQHSIASNPTNPTPGTEPISRSIADECDVCLGKCMHTPQTEPIESPIEERTRENQGILDEVEELDPKLTAQEWASIYNNGEPLFYQKTKQTISPPLESKYEECAKELVDELVDGYMDKERFSRLKRFAITILKKYF